TSFLSPKTEVRPAQSMGADCSPARPSPGMKLSPIKGGHIFDRQPAARTAAAPGSAEMQIADDLFIGPADAELVAARSLRMDWKKIRASEKISGMLFLVSGTQNPRKPPLKRAAQCRVAPLAPDQPQLSRK